MLRVFVCFFEFVVKVNPQVAVYKAKLPFISALAHSLSVARYTKGSQLKWSISVSHFQRCREAVSKQRAIPQSSISTHILISFIPPALHGHKMSSDMREIDEMKPADSQKKEKGKKALYGFREDFS